MSTKMRRNYSGAFMPLHLGGGGWRLTRTAPQTQIFLRDAESGAARAFGTAPIIDLGIEWQEKKSLLTFMSGDRVSSVQAVTAIVHEPLDHLYDSLPLASFDANARRFWRRVFRLVRFPDGHYLLKLLTHGGRR
jgi:hypothetical protein